MARQFRGNLALDLLDRFIGVGSGQIEKDCRDSSENLPGLLHRNQGVFKRGGILLKGDRAYLFELLGHPGLKGACEMLRLDRCEIGCLKRKLAGRKKWIVLVHCLGF